MSLAARELAAWAFLLAAIGCGGNAEGPGDPGEIDEDPLQDAAADCSGCKYLMKGIALPYAPFIVGEQVYLEDRGAAKLLRVPLAGGKPLLVKEGYVPHVFAITDDALYFWSPEPSDEAQRVVWRVPLPDSAAERYASYADAAAEPRGVVDGRPILKSKNQQGAAVLLRLEADGSMEPIWEWPSPDASPPSGCFVIRGSGEAIWGDPTQGLWSAAAPGDEAQEESSDFRVTSLTDSADGTVVSNYQAEDAAGLSRAFLRATDGSLNEVAHSAGEAIGAPAFFVGPGVVAQSRETNRLLLTGQDGVAKVIADSRDRLSMNPEGLAANRDYVVFVAHLNADPWLLYRIPAPE